MDLRHLLGNVSILEKLLSINKKKLVYTMLYQAKYFPMETFGYKDFF